MFQFGNSANEVAGGENGPDYYYPEVTNGIDISIGYSDAEDAYQDVMARVLDNNGNLREKLARMSSEEQRRYLRKCVKNQCKQYFREASREKERLGSRIPLADAASGEEMFSEQDLLTGSRLHALQPDRIVMLHESCTIIGEILCEFPPRYARIVQMTAMGYKEREIAEEIGVGVKSVGIRKARAIGKLEREMRERDPYFFPPWFKVG